MNLFIPLLNFLPYALVINDILGFLMNAYCEFLPLLSYHIHAKVCLKFESFPGFITVFLLLLLFVVIPGISQESAFLAYLE